MLCATLAGHVLLAPLILLATSSRVTTEVDSELNSNDGQKLLRVFHNANATELRRQRAILAEQRALQLLRAHANDQFGINVECQFGGLLQKSIASGKHG